ncbi:MAG: hypothetical protein ABIP20_19880 [Chthoniobacteraceae bacterium]
MLTPPHPRKQSLRATRTDPKSGPHFLSEDSKRTKGARMSTGGRRGAKGGDIPVAVCDWAAVAAP